MDGQGGGGGSHLIPQISVNKVSGIFKTPKDRQHTNSTNAENMDHVKLPVSENLRVNFESLKTRSGSTSTPFPTRTKVQASLYTPRDESGVFDLNVTACLFPRSTTQTQATFSDSDVDSGCSTTPSGVESMCVGSASLSDASCHSPGLRSIRDKLTAGGEETTKSQTNPTGNPCPSPYNSSSLWSDRKSMESRMTLLNYRLRRDSGNETMSTSCEETMNTSSKLEKMHSHFAGILDKKEAQRNDLATGLLAQNRGVFQSHQKLEQNFSHSDFDHKIDDGQYSEEFDSNLMDVSYAESSGNDGEIGVLSRGDHSYGSNDSGAMCRTNDRIWTPPVFQNVATNPEPHKRALFESDTADTRIRTDLDCLLQRTPSCHIKKSVTSPTNLQDSASVFTKFNSLRTPHEASLRTPHEDEVLEMLSRRKLIPSEPDRLIGRKMGLEFVDLLSELHMRNVNSVLSAILGYMDGHELYSMCDVSQSWKRICKCNTLALTKIQRHIKSLRDSRTALGSENVLKMRRSPRKSSSSRHLTDGTEPLGQVQATGKPPSPVKETPELFRHQQFLQEGKKLKCGECLRMCPKCQSPSRISPAEERAQCTRQVCSYDFCTKCFHSYHGIQACITASIKKVKTVSVIGSKKSKKNLKRL